MTLPLPDLICQLGEYGAGQVEVELGPYRVGRFKRRTMHTLIAMADMDGIEVNWRESRAFLASVFLLKMTGPAPLVHHHLARLLAVTRERA